MNQLLVGRTLTEKFESIVQVKNKWGRHVRPATYLSKILHTSQSKVTLTYKGESVNARSIMSIMVLAAPKNAKIQVEVEGTDAEETLKKLLYAFEMQFEEDA